MITTNSKIHIGHPPFEFGARIGFHARFGDHHEGPQASRLNPDQL